MRKNVFLFILLSLIVSCSSIQKIGLMSLGNLENKTLPANPEGEVKEGEHCGHVYSLAEAVRDALKNSSYDTLINVEVTHQTGVFVWSNCIKVKGIAINSNDLK